MNKYGIELKWGIIFSISTILWIGLERVVGLHDQYIAQHLYYTNLFAIVAIALYVFALKDKRDNFYNGVMNWQQGFISGIIISVVVAVLSPLALYISMTWISPIYFPNIIEYTVDNGIMTFEEASAEFNMSSYILQSAIGAIIMGVVTAAIVAVFVRRKAPPALH